MTPRRPVRAVVARVAGGPGGESRFTSTFTVGRSEDCDFPIPDPSVALRHVQVVFDGRLWWVRDLDGAGGTYLNGARIQVIPLTDSAQVELGKGGPLLSLTAVEDGGAEREPPARAAPAQGEKPAFTSETQIIRRYLRPDGGGQVGRETAMFRRAFERVQKKSSRRYRIVIAVVLLALAGAGSVIAYQARKLDALRATAERLFYTTKAIELQVAKLEELVLLHSDPKRVAELAERRAKLRQMEREYDAFLQELRVYSKIPEDERAILRVGRIFGECDVNVPKGFVPEVRRYIERWRSTERLAKALLAAKQKEYAPAVARTFAEKDLPPQYLYLALQESGFDERAVGPPTRYGHAKGMWQFITLTAHRYGLRIGPLHEQGMYDAKDERFDWRKATAAAAAYLKELNAGDAQGSGLLAMACYNWGEDNVRGIVQKMPENPRDRNFWRLLRDESVPRETYDYVLSIFSAAVICQDPRLFGFDVECPALEAPAGARAAGAGEEAKR